MNRYRYLVIFLFFLCTSLFAQTPTMTISTGKSCAGQEVLLSVTAANLENIGSITLYIDVDTSGLSFESLENIDPQLMNQFYYNFIENPPKVAVVWNSSNSVNLPQTKLFDMRFQVLNPGTAVSFATGGEIANSSYQVIGVNWLNGGVEPGNPLISVQPVDVSTSVTKTALFAVSSADATGFQWEGSQNGIAWQALQEGSYYSGILSCQLVIANVPAFLNNNKFRCITKNGDCITVSDAATLLVGPSSVNDAGGERQNFNLGNKPNPFNEFTQINYILPEEGKVHIRVCSMLGNQVAELLNAEQDRGQYTMPFCTRQLPNGIYFCQLEFKNKNSNLLLSRKMIKN